MWSEIETTSIFADVASEPSLSLPCIIHSPNPHQFGKTLHRFEIKLCLNPSEIYSKIVASNWHRPCHESEGVRRIILILTSQDLRGSKWEGWSTTANVAFLSLLSHHEFQPHPPVIRWKSPCHTAHQHLGAVRHAEKMEGLGPLQRLPRRWLMAKEC